MESTDQPAPRPHPEPAGADATSPPGSLFWLLAVLVITAAVFARGLSGELVYDDLLLVARNPLITDLARIPEIFGRPYWDFLHADAADQIGYWRPLTAVVQTLAWSLGKGSPMVFHAFCLGVHLAATAAAFFLARRLFGRVAPAGWSALLFGLHPVHVESVAWISALNDPLFGVFVLLALLGFLRWRQKGSNGIPLLAAACFALGLLAKEMAAAIVPMALAIDLGRRRGRMSDIFRDGRDLARAYAPFLVVFAIYYLARAWVFSSPFAGFDRVTTDFAVGWRRIQELRIEMFGGAIGLLAWPAELRLFRPFRPSIDATDPALVAALAWSVVFVLGLALTWRRGLRPELAGLLIVPAGLLPVVVRFESLGQFPLSDRFLYVMVFGFVIALVGALHRLLPRPATLAVLGITALGYGYRDTTRIEFWQNEETLFRTAAEETPRSPYVLWGLGRVLLNRHQASGDPRYLEEAKETYERAQDLLTESKTPGTDIMVSSNDFLQVNLGLGWAYIHEGELDEFGSFKTAIAIFEELAREVGELEDRSRQARSLGLSVRPEHLALDQVYTGLGTAHFRAGQTNEAERALKKALVLAPQNPEAHSNLAKVYAQRGDMRVAQHHTEEALKEQPASFSYRIQLAQVLHALGETERADELARQLADEWPDSAEPWVILATTHLQRRDSSAALAALDRALEADPANGYAWYHKAKALALAEVNETATIEAFKQATTLLPSNFEINYDFGAYLWGRGAKEAALPYLSRAYAYAREERHLLTLYSELSQHGFNEPGPLFELASIDSRRGRLDLAEGWLLRALQVDPNHGDSLFQLGRVLRQLERSDEALERMRRACELLPQSFVAQSELGLYLGELGRWEEAGPYLERALELEPPQSWDPALTRQAQDGVRRALDNREKALEAIGPRAGS